MLDSSQQSVASAEQIPFRHMCKHQWALELVGLARTRDEHPVDFHVRAIWQVYGMLPGLRARRKAAKRIASCINLH